ncbi:MAG: PEGA domain-containing protein [Candidatus Omnitrophota bacterium]
MKKYLYLFILLTLLITTAGWVRRTVTIDSQPQDAEIYLDRAFIGKTPCAHEFSYYGKHRLELVKEGYANYHTMLDLKGPLYEYFPLSFLSEVLVPWNINDQHFASYILEEGPTKKPVISPVIQAQPPLAPVQLEQIQEKAQSE